VSATLGIDLGERRIGIAIAEPGGFAVRPLTTLRRGRDVAADASALGALIDAHEIDEIVVGLPIDAAGHEGPQSAITRAWVEAIAPLLHQRLRITFRDERLTSHLAEQRVGPMKRGRSGGPPSRTQREAYRARVDREAAAIILQDELDTRRAAGPSPSKPPATTENPR
jgi:putative holliday junction resolvase